MWKRVGVIALWVMATVGTASITLAAVSQVGGQVSERPAVPIAGADLATTTTMLSASSTSSATPSTTSTTVATTTTTEPLASTSSTQTTSTQSPSTTQTTTSTVASTTPAASQLVKTPLVGGKVIVQHSGSVVTLISAVPESGFTAEVESGGPNQVEVEFKSENHESKYHASISNGQLDIETEEDDD